MICFCGHACHVTQDSRGQWKVNINGLHNRVLVQFQDEDVDQVRLALDLEECTLLINHLVHVQNLIRNGHQQGDRHDGA